jgi:hypothetical protein
MLVAATILVIATVAFLFASGNFIEALKLEAPELHASFGAPSINKYMWHRKLLMPFSGFILSREYREKLAPYPKSKAWASWVFAAHWAQLASVALFFVVAIRGAGA